MKNTRNETLEKKILYNTGNNKQGNRILSRIPLNNNKNKN